MSGTQAAGAAVAAGTSAAAGAPSGEAAGAVVDTSKGQGAGTEQNNRTPEKTGASAAMERAQARLAGQNKPDSGEQAAGKPGASTPAKEDGKGGDEPGKAKGEGGGAAAAPDSVVAPADWPEERRTAFEALPEPARKAVLDMHKDFQAGYTKVTQEVAEIVKAHGTLLGAMQEHGATQERVVELLGLSKAFEDNPRAVIEDLAKQKGVQVWFEQPLAPGQVPEFKDPAEMAAWMRSQAKQEAEATLRAEREANTKREAEEKAKTQREQARQALQAEFEKATKDLPDFATHRPAVVDTLSRHPSLSVEEAYHLVTLPALRKLAEDGAKAATDLAALQAKIERDAKAATKPPAGGAGTQVSEADKHLSRSERAMRRAEERLRK